MHDAETPPQPAALPFRRNRRFWSLFVADVISGFGDRVHALALYVLVFDLTGRALDLGLLAIVQVLPATLLAPFSGWLLDRVDRLRMMIYMDVARAGLVLLLPAVDSLHEILGIAVLLAVARQFHAPARMAVLPALVDREQLVKANAMSMGAHHVLLIVGPAVGGLLIAAWGTDWAFRLDAGTYLLGIGALLAVGAVPPPARKAARKGADALRGFAQEVREGATLVLGDPALRFTIGFFALFTVVASLQQPIVVVFVKDVLLAGDRGLGAIMSMAGLGGVIGSALAGFTRRWVSPLRAIALACTLDGLALAGFSLLRTLPPALILFAVFGLLGGVLQVRAVSLFQARVPDEARGRAFGWLGPIFGPLNVGSIGLGTILADRVGVVPVMMSSGLLQALLGATALLWLVGRAASLEAERPDPTPDLPAM